MSEDCTVDYQPVRRSGRGIVGIHEIPGTEIYNAFKRGERLAYYIDHTTGLWPQAASGLPFTAKEFQSKGDPITDLHEDLAAEQKARTVYDNLLRMIPDPEIREPLKFLRTREIIHFQRFGEALERIKEKISSRNLYYFNPEFDKAEAQRAGFPSLAKKNERL